MNKPGIKYISLDDIKLTVFSFVTENLKFDQPLPSFQTADKNKLSSITASLQQTVGGEDAYEGLVKKSTILLYRMIKDHPFLNGNKRMAIVTTLLFLAKNEKWLDVPWETLYQISTHVAESDPADRNDVLVFLEDLFRKSLVDAPLEISESWANTTISVELLPLPKHIIRLLGDADECGTFWYVSELACANVGAAWS